MTIGNPGFEDKAADPAGPGVPDVWLFAELATEEEFADFSAAVMGGPFPHETFEIEWPAGLLGIVAPFVATDQELGAFNIGPGQTLFEAFEKNWGTLPGFDPPPVGRQGFFELLSFTRAVFATGSDEFEDLEEGWGLTTFALGPVQSADFGGAPFEPFESEWANDDFPSSFLFLPVVPTETAQFTIPNGSGGTTFQVADRFEFVSRIVSVNELVSRLPVTATDTSSDELTIAEHDLFDDEPFTLVNENGALPTPLVEGTVYLADFIDGNTLKVKGQPSASSTQDLTDEGTGSHFLVKDPKRYWIRGLTL